MARPMLSRSSMAKSSAVNLESCLRLLTLSPPQHRPCCSHQRRASSSSSKPSSSQPGANLGPEQQEPNKDASRRANVDGESRLSARLNRRKLKGAAATDASAYGRDDAMMNLPSVPSTQHLHPADVAVSAFFSLHRPISITTSVPGVANNGSFEEIFQPGAKLFSSSEVIKTLSSAVASLNGHQHHHHHHHHHQSPRQGRSYDNATDGEFRAAITSEMFSNAEAVEGVRHLDGDAQAASQGFRNLDEIFNGKYLPFTPPPVPSPNNNNVDASNASSTRSSTTDAEPPLKTLTTMYSKILTILEWTRADGSKTYTSRASPTKIEAVYENIQTADTETSSSSPSSSPPSSASSSSTASSSMQLQPRTFMERKRLRQERWIEQHRRIINSGGGGDNREYEYDNEEGEEGQIQAEGGAAAAEQRDADEGGVMHAISVKRQRRLKMKKHKYKKLMRRTRNLRKRQERN